MYKTIVVPLNRHVGDAKAVEHAGELALLTGGSVTVVNVVHSHSRDESAFLEEQARQYLERWVEQLATRRVPASSRVLQGEPVDEIVRLAGQVGADIIVMATHGHSEWRHVLLSSVTENVIRSGDTPVLIVQADTEAKGR